MTSDEIAETLGDKKSATIYERQSITWLGKCPACDAQLCTGYNTLTHVYMQALHQAAIGKGRERHARPGQPYEGQPACQIAREVGLGFPAGQAVKKIVEAQRLLRIKGPEAAVAELLGALNYIAAEVIVIREGKTDDQTGNLRQDQ